MSNITASTTNAISADGQSAKQMINKGTVNGHLDGMTSSRNLHLQSQTIA